MEDGLKENGRWPKINGRQPQKINGRQTNQPKSS